MSPGNLDQVKAGLEAFNADDFDRALDTFYEDFTWDTTQAVPDGQVYVGREAIKRYWLDIGDRWTSLTIEADEWIESGDQVVMLGRLVGVGSGSGVPVVGPWCQVWSFEGDALVRCDNFSDPDAALAAAGLDRATRRRD
jgi:ketosteroid isomerase-like protein